MLIPRIPRNSKGSCSMAKIHELMKTQVEKGASDLILKLGTPVTIGKTAGRVVRHLGDGFAIEFNRILPLDFLEQNVTGL